MNILERRARFFQDIARLILEMKAEGIVLVPIEYFRTEGRQIELVKAGKSKTTISKHLTGLAIDLVILENGDIVWEPVPGYTLAGRIWKEMGHTWGGDWETLNDPYHFEE